MARLNRRETPFAEMQRLLRGYGLNGPKMAVAMGCSENTAKKRIDNPGLLTLNDLENISRRAQIPMDEIRGAIRIG